MRLFSLSSPLIFYLGQNVAYQLEDKENICMLWYPKGSEQHLKSYELMYDSQLWKKKLINDELVNFNITKLQHVLMPFKKINEIKRCKEILTEIIKKNKINEIFIGNRHAPIDRLLYFVGKENGCKINLLEDGLTLYYNFVYSDEIDKTRLNKENLKSLLKNSLYKIINYEKVFNNNLDLKFNDVYVSYPRKYYLENYTGDLVQMRFDHDTKGIIDKKLIEKDNLELKRISNKKTVLFLSQSLSEDGLVNLNREVDIITKYLGELPNSEYMIYLKPHPRDKKEKIEQVKSILNDKVIILDNSVPIPIEVHLSIINIDMLVGIGSAALFYSPLISPHVENIVLLHKFVDEIEKNNEDNKKIKRIYNTLYPIFKEEVKWKI